MKRTGGLIFVTGFVIVLSCALLATWLFVEAMTPAVRSRYEQMTALKAQDMANANLQRAQRREQTTAFLSAALPFVLLLAGGGAVLYGWVVYDRRKEAWARPLDGQYPLQVLDNGREIWIVDPNKQLFGVVGFNKQTGQLITDGQAVGPDRQLAYACDVQKTRTASAITAGNGFKYAATGKYLAGSYDRSELPVPPWIKPPQQPQHPIFTVFEAFNHSSTRSWILGQNRETGEVFSLNPHDVIHFGIVGATGTGKTAYIGLLLMAYALRSSFRLIVLDGKGGADWSRFAQLIEYHELDYTNVEDLVAQVSDEYERRQTLLNRHGAHSIFDLRAAGVNPPRPTMVFIDEFGAVMDSLKAVDPRGAYRRVGLDFGNVLRLARATGLYVVLYDQDPTKWPGTVTANMPTNLCFRLGGNKGNAINEYNLNELERTGHFQVSGARYHAWPTYEAVDALLDQIEYQKPRALLTGCTGVGEGRGEHRAPPPVYSTQPVHPEVADTRAVQADTHQPVHSDTPLLQGKPVSKRERQLVLDTYQETGSNMLETCNRLWGGRNPSRIKWVKEIVGE